jgi:hypothetical protein
MVAGWSSWMLWPLPTARTRLPYIDRPAMEAIRSMCGDQHDVGRNRLGRAGLRTSDQRGSRASGERLRRTAALGRRRGLVPCSKSSFLTAPKYPRRRRCPGMKRMSTAANTRQPCGERTRSTEPWAAMGFARDRLRCRMSEQGKIGLEESGCARADPPQHRNNRGGHPWDNPA